MRIRLLQSLASCLAITPVLALAQAPRSAGFEPNAWALINARVVVSPEQELPSATVVIRDGLIAAVAANLEPPPDAHIIDLSGHIIYPGFIDAATQAPLDPQKSPPPDAGRALETSRFALAGIPVDNRKGLTPEFSPRQNLKNEPPLWESRRQLGFTALHVLPQGRLASGSGLLISTSGLPLRESVLREQTFPEFQLFPLGQTGYPFTLMGGIAHLRQALLDARRWQQHRQLFEAKASGVPRPPEDPVLEALAQTLSQHQPSFWVAQSRDEIHRALDFAAEHQLAPVLVGAGESWRTLDRLKAESRGIIALVNWGDEPRVEPTANNEGLTPKTKLPRRVQQRQLDRWNDQVANLKMIHESGLKLAVGTDGLSEPGHLFRSLRQAIAKGLSPQGALAALTREPAALLGMADRLGTLEVGKLAHIAVLTGPFQDERSKVRHLFVDGRHFEYHKDAQPVPPPAPPPPPNAALAGQWNLEIDSGDGKLFGTLELIQNNANLTGLFRSPQGDGKLSSGRVEGRHFEFTVAIGAGAQALDLKFQGDIDEAQTDRGQGQLKSAFGGQTKFVIARQAGATADQPPTGQPTLEVGDKNPEKVAQTEIPTELDSDRLRRPEATGGTVFLRGGTVLTGFGPPLPQTHILVRGGKIAAIGPQLEPDAGMPVIDVTGRFVAAGIIDTHSHIMFPEGLGGVNEATSSLVPEVRVRDVVRTEDPAAYRALAGGVTAIRMLHGSANVVGGQDAVVKLKYGALAKDQLLHGNPQGVKFALGENVKRQRGRFPNTRMGVEATLNRAFLEAIDYRREWQEYDRALQAQTAAGQPIQLLPPRRDLRLEALADIVNHQKFIHSHCYRADEILMLLRVASGLGIRVWSLQHVLEGYKIAPEIAAHGASCSTFGDWWAYKVEAFDATPYNASLLHEAGVNVVLKSDDAELMRHLYIEAAKMIRYGGTPADAAWRMVTLNAARELGLADRMGSIEVGKDADLVVYTAHPLNIFSRVERTLIDGETWFLRETQPSTMSETAAKNSAQPPAWEPPAAEMQARQLDLSMVRGTTYGLRGAKIHPLDGPTIENGVLLIHGPHIAAVGAQVVIPEGTPVLDTTGLHIYPGLIDAGSILGLQEIGSVDETHDYGESGQIQPDLRTGVAVNPDSELIPVARAGGITSSLIRPAGPLVAGQSSWMQLHGWTIPELIRDFEVALQIEWPSGNDNQGQIEQITRFLGEARTYLKLKEQAQKAQAPLPIVDPRFEALEPYLARRKKVHIEADSRTHIAEAILWAEKEQLAVVITGGAEAWKLANELKKREIPVILGAVMRRPFAEHDAFDTPYANAGRLHEAGVLFAIRSNATGTAGFSASNARNAPFEAGISVAYGLPEEIALKSVTIHAAQILGRDSQVGTLAAGKLADFIVTDGSPLQPSTGYKAVVIAGKAHVPESRHSRLYERYRGRLREVQAQGTKPR
jgi:imidazolonepropionase-like amidohydrolase